MASFAFKVDEIEIAGGEIVGSATGTFEADEFDYGPSNVEIDSYELWLHDSEPVELTAEQTEELLDVITAALSGVERAEYTVSVSAAGIEV